ncbi:M48 family metallopeptidase [Marinomonas sp.]
MAVSIYPAHQKLSFIYGEERIEYELLKGLFSTRKVIIKVYPDCRVAVTAPENTGESDVLLAVKKKGRWIYEQLREFRQQQEHVRPRQYISGESHYYLGKQYLLKVEELPRTSQSVKMTRGRLEVVVKYKTAEKVREQLISWYKLKAKDIFSKRLDAMLEQALWVERRPSIRVLAMNKQWGSCSPNGRITLNLHLIKAPRECIDYVILHELCHIAEHNHSERFYRLMGQVMPNWESVKERLDSMSGKFIS